MAVTFLVGRSDRLLGGAEASKIRGLRGETIQNAICLIATLLLALGARADGIQGLLSADDLDRPCIQAMKKADPDLKFSGGQFLLMQRAVQLADPLTAASFYEDPSHSKHFIARILVVWNTQCKQPGQSLAGAAHAVAHEMKGTFPQPSYMAPAIAVGND